jgi:flagellar biosynthesis chaperone FliJ
MTTRRPDEDKALGAVERVRHVREQDSRIGLQRALATSAADAAAVQVTQLMMELHPAFGHGSVRDFHADRFLITTMAQQHQRERQRAEASRGVAEEAQRRWQLDQTRVRAVELLLARRAAARRAERERREAHELDDLAGQAWLRHRYTRLRGNH